MDRCIKVKKAIGINLNTGSCKSESFHHVWVVPDKAMIKAVTLGLSNLW